MDGIAMLVGRIDWLTIMIELYFKGSAPNDGGQLEDIYVFGNMDATKKIAGPAVTMTFN